MDGQMPPNMPPAGMPPSTPPPSSPSSPLSALASAGGGNSGSLLQTILTFLAGAGLSPTLDSITKLLGKGPGSKGAKGQPGQPPPGGSQPGGPPQGGPQIPPQAILQMLAQRGQGGQQ